MKNFDLKDTFESGAPRDNGRVTRGNKHSFENRIVPTAMFAWGPKSLKCDSAWHGTTKKDWGETARVIPCDYGLMLDQ